MKNLSIKLFFILGFASVFVMQANAQLCGQYRTTLNIVDNENKPVENALVQLLPIGADQTRGKSFVRDEQNLSKFSISFFEGHQISNTYRLLVWADDFDSFEQEIRFSYCKQQEFNIKLPAKENSNYVIVSGTVKIRKKVSDEPLKFEQEIEPDVYINFKSENGKKFSTTSDKDGNYKIELPEGIYDVYAVETNNNCNSSDCNMEFYKRDILISDKSQIRLDINLDFSGCG